MIRLEFRITGGVFLLAAVLVLLTTRPVYADTGHVEGLRRNSPAQNLCVAADACRSVLGSVDRRTVFAKTELGG